LDSLIKAGAFDRFGDRATLLHNLDLMLAFAARLQKQATSGQTDIFGNSPDTALPRTQLELQAAPAAISNHEQLLWERELLGLYLSQHPLEMFETILSEKTVPLNTITAGHDGKQISIGGAIADFREITTKSGQRMAFVKLEDRFGEIEVILFPNSYQQTIGLWERDRVVLIRGKVSARDRDGNNSDEVKITVDDAREITAEQAAAYEATGKKPKTPKVRSTGPTAQAKTSPVPPPEKLLPERVYVRLVNTQDQQMLLSLKQTIDRHQGETEVILVLGEATSKQAIKLPVGIDRASDGLTKLQELVGPDNLVIQ
jgi:DNA polymerase-3 subunit alpha